MGLIMAVVDTVTAALVRLSLLDAQMFLGGALFCCAIVQCVGQAIYLGPDDWKRRGLVWRYHLVCMSATAWLALLWTGGYEGWRRYLTCILLGLVSLGMLIDGLSKLKTGLAWKSRRGETSHEQITSPQKSVGRSGTNTSDDDHLAR